MIRAALRSLLARKLRMLLTGLAVALGVMFASASLVTTDVLSRSFTDLMDTAYAGSDVVVTGEAIAVPNTGVVETEPVPARALAEVSQLPGVRQATGVIFTDGARVVDRRTGRVLSTFGGSLGLNWYGEDGFTELRTGRGPTSDDEVAINATLASLGDFGVGDQIEVLTREPRRTFTVVGVFGYRGGRGSLYGETGVAFTTPVAQQLMYGERDVFTEIDVRGTGELPAEPLRDLISHRLGDTYLVGTGAETADERSGRLRDSITAYRYILLGFAGVVLLVGALLVFNTFAMLVAQRTRELALLRAVGASRRQVVGVVLVEALLVGSASSAIGLGLGIVVGWLLTQLLADVFGGAASTAIEVSPAAVATSLALGLLATCVAALRPALRASRVAPMVAIREPAGAGERSRPSRRRVTAGIAAVAVGGSLLAPALAGYRGTLSPLLLSAGVPLVFTGALIVSAAVAGPAVSIIGLIFAFSVPGELGRRNTARNPQRTAVTAAALTVGMTLVTAVAVVASSSAATMDDEITESLRAQLVISGSQTALVPPSFDPAVLREIRQWPEVAAVAPVWSDFVEVPGGAGVLRATDDVSAWLDVTGVRFVSGSAETLGSGEIIVDDQTAADQGLALGDRIRIELPRGGEREYTVVGVYTRQPEVAEGPLIGTADAALFRSPNPTRAFVRLHDDADATAVRVRLDRLLVDSPEVQVQDQRGYIAERTRTFEQTRTNVNLLLALAILVATLGIVNTLVMSVFERMRELGMLRALGLSRLALVRMVMVESVVIALFGAGCGVVLGGLLGAAVARGLRGDGITELSIPWSTMAGYLLSAVLVGVVAAIFPAVRASRVGILPAIAER